MSKQLVLGKRNRCASMFLRSPCSARLPAFVHKCHQFCWFLVHENSPHHTSEDVSFRSQIHVCTHNFFAFQIISVISASNDQGTMVQPDGEHRPMMTWSNTHILHLPRNGALQSARLPVTLIGSPINSAYRLDCFSDHFAKHCCGTMPSGSIMVNLQMVETADP